MKILEQLSPYYVVTTLNPPSFNWFAGTFSNLPVDREVTIGFSMVGMGNVLDQADVTKWKGLSPVMTYADPRQYDTYTWYQKDANGHWFVGNSIDPNTKQDAGSGKVPEQYVIARELADQFLSPDGAYWQPWREVDHTECLTDTNIFRITQRYAASQATIAMRIPYTYTYNMKLVSELQRLQLPGVHVDVVSITPTYREVHVIRIEDPAADQMIHLSEVRKSSDGSLIPQWKITPDSQKEGKTHQVVIIYAREHAVEQDGSWVVYGLLRDLIQNTIETRALRKNTTWLLIPLIDPDSSAQSTYGSLCGAFWKGGAVNQQALDLMSYIKAFLSAKQPVSLVLSIHNVECNEMPTVSIPYIPLEQREKTRIFTKHLYQHLQEHNTPCYNLNSNNVIDVSDKMNFTLSARFAGWCSRQSGALSILCEVNGRYPAHKLTLTELQNIGHDIALTIGDLSVDDKWQQHLDELGQMIEKNNYDGD